MSVDAQNVSHSPNAAEVSLWLCLWALLRSCNCSYWGLQTKWSMCMFYTRLSSVPCDFEIVKMAVIWDWIAKIPTAGSHNCVWQGILSIQGGVSHDKSQIWSSAARLWRSSFSLPPPEPIVLLLRAMRVHYLLAPLDPHGVLLNPSSYNCIAALPRQTHKHQYSNRPHCLSPQCSSAQHSFPASTLCRH